MLQRYVVRQPCWFIGDETENLCQFMRIPEVPIPSEPYSQQPQSLNLLESS